MKGALRTLLRLRADPIHDAFHLGGLPASVPRGVFTYLVGMSARSV